jgi:hypothetical protein
MNKWIHTTLPLAGLLALIGASGAWAADPRLVDLATVERIVFSRGGKVLGYAPCREDIAVLTYRNRQYCVALPDKPTGLMGIEHTAQCCTAPLPPKMAPTMPAPRPGPVASRPLPPPPTKTYTAKTKQESVKVDPNAVIGAGLTVLGMFKDYKMGKLKYGKGLEGSPAKDLSVEQAPMAEISPAKPGSGQVSVMLDKQDGTYRIGEAVSIQIKVDKDSYVTVFDTGSSGKTHVIFPNKYQTDNFVRAGQVVDVPGRKAGFDFIAGGPQGTDLITVVASGNKRSLTSGQNLAAVGPFQAMAKDAPAVAKDLSVELKNNHAEKWSSSTAKVRIVE